MNSNRGLFLVAAMALVGCKDNTMQNNPLPDLSMMQMMNKDLSMTQNMGDMTLPPTMCQPDPGMDGQQCGNGCPQGSGTIGVRDQGGACHCWYTCTPDQVNSCPCGRTCAKLFTLTDAGQVPNGQGACLHANGAGERCGQDSMGMPFGYGNCQDGTLCVNEDMAGKFAFCMYKCTKQSDCPSETACLALQNGGSVCAINTTENMPKMLGATCAKDDLCAVDTACDGTCKQGCDGPNDKTTCTNGTTCTALVDSANNNKITAYVCK